jgi:hypothetical protein
MNFGPNRVVQVLAIATHRTRLGFGVQAKWVWVQVFQVSIFRLMFYAQNNGGDKDSSAQRQDLE